MLAQSQPSLKIERITDRTRTLESGSKFFDERSDKVDDQDSRVVVRTVRDTVYIERKDTVEVLRRAKRQSRAQGVKLQGASSSLNPHPSPLNLIKWIIWILIGLIGLIVTVKICHRR